LIAVGRFKPVASPRELQTSNRDDDTKTGNDISPCLLQTFVRVEFCFMSNCVEIIDSSRFLSLMSIWVLMRSVRYWSASVLRNPLTLSKHLRWKFLDFVTAPLAAISVDHNANGPGPECVKVQRPASYDRCPISQRTTMRTSPGRNPKSNSNSAAAICACIPQVVIGVSVRNEETALA